MYTAANLCIIQYVLLERTLDFSLYMFFTSKNYFSEIIVIVNHLASQHPLRKLKVRNTWILSYVKSEEHMDIVVSAASFVQSDL